MLDAVVGFQIIERLSLRQKNSRQDLENVMTMYIFCGESHEPLRPVDLVEGIVCGAVFNQPVNITNIALSPAHWVLRVSISRYRAIHMPIVRRPRSKSARLVVNQDGRGLAGLIPLNTSVMRLLSTQQLYKTFHISLPPNRS
jgi:hypothetical protein